MPRPTETWKETGSGDTLVPIALRAQRYQDAMIRMTQIAASNKELRDDQRAMFTATLYRLTADCRRAWRVVSAALQHAQSEARDTHVALAQAYLDRITNEIRDICNNAAQTLARHLIPTATDPEDKAAYLTMSADCYRYLAECASGQDRGQHIAAALEAYTAASNIATAELLPANPIRLGLAVNFSVFQHEMLDSPSRACHLARQAIDAAQTQLHTVSDDSNGTMAHIMRLHHENLEIWTT